MKAFFGFVAAMLVATLAASDALAQGRGRAADDRGGGPAFCRSGAGHPVFGWRWCEERGWGSAGRIGPDARRNPPTARSRFPDRESGRRVGDVAFDHGRSDGYDKGLEDARARREYDPVRHRWYRDGDRGYDGSYGTRAQYQDVYRDGFRAGYETGYRDGERYGTGRTEDGGRWPF